MRPSGVPSRTGRRASSGSIRSKTRSPKFHVGSHVSPGAETPRQPAEYSPVGTTFSTLLKAGPAGGRLRRPSSRRQRHGGHRGTGLTRTTGGARAVRSAPWYRGAGCSKLAGLGGRRKPPNDLGHHSPADSQRLRRGRCQDRRPYAPRQAGGAIARPAMEGYGWRIPSKLGTAGPHRGHIRATNDRTAADNNGHSRPALALLTGHTPPSAAGRRDRSGLSDTEGVTGSNPVAPTIPLLSRAFVDSVVPRVARRPVVGRPQRQESTSLRNQGVHFCGFPNL
jgi:hypothetical protein